MHLAGCCESLNEPKFLVPVPAPAARSGSTGHQLAELGCVHQELLGWVFFLALLHELHHDSHPVGRADGCLLLLPPPHSGPWWLLPSSNQGGTVPGSAVWLGAFPAWLSFSRLRLSSSCWPSSSWAFPEVCEHPNCVFAGIQQTPALSLSEVLDMAEAEP